MSDLKKIEKNKIGVNYFETPTNKRCHYEDLVTLYIYFVRCFLSYKNLW